MSKYLRRASFSSQASQCPPSPLDTPPILLVEKELQALRRNVEKDLVHGLREELQKIFLETVLHVASDPDLLFATRGLHASSVVGLPSSQDSVQIPTLDMVSNLRSSFSSLNHAMNIDDDIKPPEMPEDEGILTGVPDHLLAEEIHPPPSVIACVGNNRNRDKSGSGAPTSPTGNRPERGIAFEEARGVPGGAIPSDAEAYDDQDETKGYDGKPKTKEEDEAWCEDWGDKGTLAGALSRTGTLVTRIIGSSTSSRVVRLGESMQASQASKWFIPTDPHNKVGKTVRSDNFDYCMSVILILNSITIGVRADWEASNLGESDLAVYIWLDRLFCVLFTAELTLRLYTFRLSFYIGHGSAWAYFDTVIVGFQIIEETMLIAAGEAAINIGFLKMLKMGRLLRMVRMVRLLPELKSLVLLIMASMSSFIWTCVLLLLLVYMLSVYMVMMAVESLESTVGQDRVSRQELQQYWGSVGSAVLSLYWSITGGQDWAVVIGPLVQETGTQLHNVVFSMFIAFATMVLMNLVTGVFVEGAARLTKEDRDKELSRMAHKVFRLVDDDCSEEITKEEFQRHMDSGSMDFYLNAVDLPQSAADNLFEILDTDGTDSINVNEFVDGCLRLRGLPRSADITQLLMESRKARTSQKEWFVTLSSLLMQCRHEVRQMQVSRIPMIRPMSGTTMPGNVESC